ncbi:pentapeptide repeat-containing protein, partial [Clostridioides difficile]|nr:pentapeptide repeat-containing protein [Clostridioides difficile]
MTKIIKVQKPKFTGELEIIENLEDILEDIFNDEKIFNKII